MSRSTNSDLRAKLLQEANLDWSAVYKDAERFLALPHAKQALTDDHYRTNAWRALHADAAEKILYELNNTQKMVEKFNGQTGMLPLSIMMEQFNLLLEGHTFQTRSKLELSYFVVSNNSLATASIIKVIHAVKVQIFVTYGALQPNVPDSLVTETHGLHVVLESSTNALLPVLPRYNQMATEEELTAAYSYNNPTALKLFNRLQGVRFRMLKLCEFCEATIPLLAANQVATTLVTEEADRSVLNRGKRPTFFAGRYNIGPVFNETIDITSSTARQQIIAALPHICQIIESSVKTY